MARMKRIFIGKAFVCFLSFTIGICLFVPPVFSDITAVQDVTGNKATSGQVLPDTGNVTVNFKDVDITTVLQYLSEVSGIDIVPSPEVAGTVTMRLRDKPWEVALDVVTRNRGYVYSRDDDKGIIRVMPKSKLEEEEPISEVIYLNYIHAFNREEEAALNVTSVVGVTSLISAISTILARTETATYVPDANALVITAIPARVGEIKKLVQKLDIKTPQIMLEAKVLEVTLDKNDQFGIDWNMVVSAAGAQRPTTFPFTNNGALQNLPATQRKFFPTATPGMNDASFPLIDTATLIAPMLTPTPVGLFAYGTLDFSQFTAVLRMIDNRDNVNIISTPRITTLNNQPAVIKVINNLYLQKQVKSTDTATLVTVEFEKDPRETGVILQVTPHVNDRGEITVDLQPQVSTLPQFTELRVNGAQNTVAMQFNSREADTQVMVKDGDTIFIGGLITEQVDKEEHKVPILGDLFGWIPIVGSAVKYNQDNVDKTEVVFFVTVHLIESSMDSIKKSGFNHNYDQYFTVKGNNYSHLSNESVVNNGILKNSAETVEIPVDSAVDDDKKKAFWEFWKKK